MIITKKATAAADFFAGSGSGAGAAAVGRDGSVADGGGRHAGQSGSSAAVGLCLYADGVRRNPLDSARRGHAR